MAAVLICGTDKNGLHLPIGIHYDEKTGLASLAISRGAGKNTFTEEYAASQTNTAVLTPTAAQKLCIASVYCRGAGDTGTVSLDFATSSKKVFRHYQAKRDHSFDQDLHIEGAAGEALTLNTTTGNEDLWLVVNYRLVT